MVGEERCFLFEEVLGSEPRARDLADRAILGLGEVEELPKEDAGRDDDEDEEGPLSDGSLEGREGEDDDETESPVESPREGLGGGSDGLRADLSGDDVGDGSESSVVIGVDEDESG